MSQMLRGIWTWLVFTVSTVALAVAATAGSLLRPGSNLTVRLGRVWARLVLGAGGVRVLYNGERHARERHPCIFMCNHQSAIDVWALVGALPDSTCFVAKRSLFRIPFIGWAMAAAGFVPIDRQDRSSAIGSLSRALEQVRAGRSLILFPEGTRSRDGRLGAFKKGPFHLALEAGVPVVPAAVSGSFGLLPPGALFLRPGQVRVSFAPPLDPRAYGPEDVEGLLAAVRRAIAERLDPWELEPSPLALPEGSR